MIWKLTIFLGLACCCLGDEHQAVSHQNLVQHYQPEYHGHHGELSHIGSHVPEHKEYAWTYPAYEYSYNVDDPHTHDHKGQHEVRDGDTVKGMYWLIQPDGRKRTVTYYADKHHGFNAHVEYSDPHHPVPHHPVPLHPLPLHPVPLHPVPLHPVPLHPVPLHPVPLHPLPLHPVPLHSGPLHPVPNAHYYEPAHPKEYHNAPKAYINTPVNHFPVHYDAKIHHNQPLVHHDVYNHHNQPPVQHDVYGHHNYYFKPNYDPHSSHYNRY